jgi:hypothetical protein
MRKRISAWRLAGGALLASGLLAAAYAPGNAQSAPVGQPQIEVTDTGPEEIGAAPASPAQPNPGAVVKPLFRPPTAAPRHPSIEMPGVPLINAVHPGVSGCTTCAGSHLGLVSNDNVKQNGPTGEVTPPDQGLAANNGKILEAVNDVLRVTNSTALLAGPVGIPAFLGNKGLFVTDPQVFFDPLVNRWFFTILVATNDTFIPGQLWIAVSKSANPNPLTATNWRIGAKLSFGNVIPDYPKSGFNKDVFVITADIFNSPTNFLKADIVALSIKDLVSGAKAHQHAFAVPSSFVVQPSLPACSAPVGGKPNCEPSVTAAGGVEYLLSAQNIQDNSQNIRVFALSNTSLINTTPSALRLKFKDIPANKGGNPGYDAAVASPDPGPVGPFCGPEGFSSPPPIGDGNYHSFQASVQQASGNLFGVLNFGITDAAKKQVDALLWFKLKPTVDGLGNVTAVTATQGYIFPPTGYSLIYPAFALHKAGDGVLGVTISNRSAAAIGGFPSAAFIRFNGTAPVGNILVSGKGFQADDDFSACSPPPVGDGISRWGDYGAAVVDAASGKFFIANEYIPKRSTANPLTAVTNWGTFVTLQ